MGPALYFDTQGADRPHGYYGRNLAVVVQHVREEAVFEIRENTGVLWTTPGAPREISTLLVTSERDGRALWQVEALSPRAGAITYARVPDGFAQMIPSSGPPAPLRPGERYVVVVRGAAGTARATFGL